MDIRIGSRGFTVVELLIAIVVIGIMSTLVLNSFTGAQARARDAERQSDIKALSKALEAFYVAAEGYPRVTGLMDSPAWISANLPGLDMNALVAPGAAEGAVSSLANTSTPALNQYGYQVRDHAINTVCTPVNNLCPRFLLFWREESSGAVKTLTSLNN